MNTKKIATLVVAGIVFIGLAYYAVLFYFNNDFGWGVPVEVSKEGSAISSTKKSEDATLVTVPIEDQGEASLDDAFGVGESVDNFDDIVM